MLTRQPSTIHIVSLAELRYNLVACYSVEYVLCSMFMTCATAACVSIGRDVVILFVRILLFRSGKIFLRDFLIGVTFIVF